MTCNNQQKNNTCATKKVLDFLRQMYYIIRVRFTHGYISQNKSLAQVPLATCDICGQSVQPQTAVTGHTVYGPLATMCPACHQAIGEHRLDTK